MNWDIKAFLSKLTEEKRRLDIGDNVEIFYKENLLPVKINGDIRPELKIVKGSYCIYELSEQNYFNMENEVEMIAIEEYSDSPYSIYIDEHGVVDSYEYEDIQSIELGENILLRIEDTKVLGYFNMNKK